MTITLTLLTLASICYVVGGIAMKYSQGFQNYLATFLVFVFFLIGAGIQTGGMKKAELGSGYVFVLGLEGVLAVIAGLYFFDEALTPAKTLGTLLVIAGIILVKS